MRQRDPSFFFPFFAVCGKHPENKVVLLSWFERLFRIELNIFTGWLCIKDFTLWRSQKQFSYTIFTRKANYSMAHKIFFPIPQPSSHLSWKSSVNSPCSEGHWEVQLNPAEEHPSKRKFCALVSWESEEGEPRGSSALWEQQSLRKSLMEPSGLSCGRNHHNSTPLPRVLK